jgi:two-component system sensor kinase FixL
MTLDVDAVAFDDLEYSVGYVMGNKPNGAYLEALQSLQSLRSMLDDAEEDSGQSTARAESLMEQPLFGALLRSSPDAIVVCSFEGVIHCLNPAAHSMFGYNAEEIGGQKFASLLMPVPSDELALSPVYWHTNAKAGSLKARKKSGEIFPVDITKAQVETHGVKLNVVFFRDASCKQRLKQQVRELQNELAYMSRFNVLSGLATAIGHEVKQPLAAITTYTAAARHVSSTSQDPAMRQNLHLLDKIAAQASRCGDIIHKLRRLVSDRSVDKVYDDLSTTVQEAVQLASMGAARHNIHINVSLPPQPVIILMDRSQLLMLVGNLVKNAVEELATWRGERTIDVALTLPSPELAELMVADTGPGIPSAAFEKIFDPFHTTKPDGTGMGLALSRRIAEAHSGRLAAANRPSGGAVFRFIIPIGKGEKGE